MSEANTSNLRLKECPFCHGPHVGVISATSGTWYAECESCEAMGPTSTVGEKRAAEMWNERPHDWADTLDEIERLRGEAEVADEQLAQLRGFAQDHQKCELIREENQRFRQALESISEIGVSERVGINKHKLHAAMDTAKRALIPVPAARPCGCVGGTCVTQTQDWKLPPGVYCSFETAP
jgi:hypothetical protein